MNASASRRPKRLRLLAFVATIAALASACGGGSDDTTAGAGAGEVLGADVLTGTATTVDGESVDLATLADKDLVVWFWAPW